MSSRTPARIEELQKQAAERDDVIGFAGGLPASDLLPREELARALAEVATTDDAALQYGWPEGTPDLRAWVARRLAARGATIDPERVIITAGAQQALAIATHVLGDRSIAVGDATYQGALDAFGPRAAARGDDVRYVIAGVANPQGTPQEPSGELLDSARELIVDEAYAELRFDGRVLPPLIGQAPERVWHVGTVSKTIAPGLRVGWLVPPDRHHTAALDFKHEADLQTASVSQIALARLFDLLDFDALLAKARTVYAARAVALAEALRRHAPDLRFTDPIGAFSIWIETGEHGDEIALLEAALEEGVMFDPGSYFRPVRDGDLALRLCYSNAPVERFDEGVQRLGRALARWRERSVRSAASSRSARS
jgi:2-aminoadipate transaminase